MGALLKPGDLVVDAGANIGNHSLYFAGIRGCKVVAFEPIPQTAKVLKHNIEINFLDELIELRNRALGATRGNAVLDAYDENNVGAARLTSRPGLHFEAKFVVSTLDEEFFSQTIRLLKVDVEGMDLEVLEGAQAIINRDRPIITCEAATETSRGRLLDWAAATGYTWVGTYCATATLILAPNEVDRRNDIELIRSAQARSSSLRTTDLEARLLRSNRYTERLHREALALNDELTLKLESLHQQVEGLEARMKDGIRRD
ncbi:FkbM family methyltransferase [Arthrobacter sp. TMP15]|uniref:FkbM family methyltransferase n=1 Tax=Arthrobacter sp. TMP15 TaxID=3140789 RepID=UPI0031BAA470